MLKKAILGKKITMVQKIKLSLPFVLAAILFVGGCLPALGDGNIVLNDKGYQEKILSMAVMGEDLFLLANSGLWHWHPGLEAPVLISDEIKGDLYNIQTGALMAPQEGTSAPFVGFDGTVQHLVGYEGKLWALNSYTGVLCTIEQKEGDTQKEVGWALRPRLQLPWEGLVNDGDYGPVWPKPTDPPFMQGGKLFVFEGDWWWTAERRLHIFDLVTGEKEVITANHIQSLAPYKNGALLAVLFNQQEATYGYTDEGEPIIEALLGTFAIPGGAFTPLIPAPGNETSGLVYHPGNDRVYMASDGKTFTWAFGEEESQHINYTSFGNYYEPSWGLMLGEELYAELNNGEVFVRNINQNVTGGGALTIYGVSAMFNEEIRAFQRLRGDIALNLIEENWVNPINPVQNMLLEDDSIDLYYLTTDTHAYKALVSKGYALSLEGSAIITQAVKTMYPKVQKALAGAQGLAAFPVYFNLITLGMNAPLAEEMGIQPPATWGELLALYNQWGEGYSQDYPQFTLDDFTHQFTQKGEAGRQLFNMIAMAYIREQYLHHDGRVRFNTDGFRALLAAFEQARPFIDQGFTAPREGESFISYEEPPETALIKWFNSLTFENVYSPNIEPLALSAGEDENPVIPAKVGVYIINPFSQNQQEALLFLETLAQNLPRKAAVTLTPGDNEPLYNVDTLNEINNLKKDLLLFTREMGRAEGINKQNYKADIAAIEKTIAMLENSESLWAISPRAINAYRALEGKWEVLVGSPTGNNPQVMAIIQTYYEGELPMEEMITKLDRIMEIMEMEGE